MRKYLALFPLCGLTLFFLQAIETYDEPFRPQFHFTPATNWMNDPNGLVFYKGEYHLFYQYNPFRDQWGHMSWGHAVSPDMVRWKHLPVALMEEDGIMIFSGSVVVDWRNTSQLCRNKDPNDQSCLIAIYTGRTTKRQTQNLAFSNDRGRTWTKYQENPVIDLGMHDFRDPKVFWHRPSGKWIMVTALARQKKVRFFASADLKSWKELSDFGPAGATSGVWECPDLFPLNVEGAPGRTRWVLSVNMNPGAVAGGSGNQYFVGRFNGNTFVNENADSKVLWVDYGKDFYASTSFSDIPSSDGRRIWMGWLSDWQYAGAEPTTPWRGTQSIPRTLKLKSVNGSLRLVQEPIAELKKLRGERLHFAASNVTEANRPLQTFRSNTYEITAELEPGSATEIGFKIHKGSAEETLVGYSADRAEMFVDRTKSGQTGFSKDFPGRHAAPASRGERVRMHVFVDTSSVELFGDDGGIVLSDRIFPSPDSNRLELFAKGSDAKVASLDIWTLRSAWTQ